MAKSRTPTMPFFVLAAMVFIMVTQANATVPYKTPSCCPSGDPKVLEQTPQPVLQNLETHALARSDWKETAAPHVISLDIPGLKKNDIKIEVEENRVLRVSGERKNEEEVEGEKWHRAEMQFRLTMNADMDHIKAILGNGVLRITVPKFAEDKRRQPKVVNIAEEGASSGEDIKATKAEL